MKSSQQPTEEMREDATTKSLKQINGAQTKTMTEWMGAEGREVRVITVSRIHSRASGVSLGKGKSQGSIACCLPPSLFISLKYGKKI